MLLLMVLLVLLMPIVYIIITTWVMMRSTIQARMTVRVGSALRTSLIHSFTGTRRRGRWSRSTRGVYRGILDIHEWLPHSDTIAGIGATVIGIRLTVVWIGIIVGKWGRVPLLTTLSGTTCGLSL